MSNIPTNRADAKAQGARHYFTGKPCKHGHIALRETKGSCVECRKIEHEASYASRKEYFAAYNKSEKGVENKKKHYEANKELIISRANTRPEEDKKKYRKAWFKNNPEETKAIANARRRRNRDATPKWLTEEHKKEMRDIYLKAQRLSRETGIMMHVDHIEPISSDEVCGLHVPWNLQILVGEVNVRKSNKRFENA